MVAALAGPRATGARRRRRPSGHRMELPAAAAAAARRGPGAPRPTGVLRLARAACGEPREPVGRRPGRHAPAARGPAPGGPAGDAPARTSPRASARVGLAAAHERFALGRAALLVESPFWAPLAAALKARFGWRVVYDCLDAHEAFATNRPAALADAERDLVRGADLVVATSEALRRRLEGGTESPPASSQRLRLRALRLDRASLARGAT